MISLRIQVWIKMILSKSQNLISKMNLNPFLKSTLTQTQLSQNKFKKLFLILLPIFTGMMSKVFKMLKEYLMKPLFTQLYALIFLKVFSHLPKAFFYMDLLALEKLCQLKLSQQSVKALFLVSQHQLWCPSGWVKEKN